jgi:hypothetical protein
MPLATWQLAETTLASQVRSLNRQKTLSALHYVQHCWPLLLDGLGTLGLARLCLCVSLPSGSSGGITTAHLFHSCSTPRMYTDYG